MKNSDKKKFFENARTDHMFKIMKYYKNIIWLLVSTNLICLITIAFLHVEINLLEEKLLEMNDNSRALEDKISIMESSQNEHINISCEKVIKKNNVNACILVGTVIVIGVIALICFGGVDPGNLGKSLNLSSCQSKTDLINHNILIDENPNFGLSISSMDVINDRVMKEVVEIGSITDSTCNKLETIFEQDNY